MLSRREVFIGLAGVLAMPAIARANSLMRIKPPLIVGQHDIVVHVVRNDDGTFDVLCANMEELQEDIAPVMSGRRSDRLLKAQVNTITRRCSPERGWEAFTNSHPERVMTYVREPKSVT